jgi:hypothetical protein
MNSKLFEKVLVGTLVSFLVGCVSSGDADVSHAVKALEEQPRQRALDAFGPPRQTTIENGTSVSYWPMTEVEQFVGPSNLREFRTVDGKAVISETQGVKLKERRLDCVVKISANTASIITKSEIIGDPGGCAKVAEKLK